MIVLVFNIDDLLNAETFVKIYKKNYSNSCEPSYALGLYVIVLFYDPQKFSVVSVFSYFQYYNNNLLLFMYTSNIGSQKTLKLPWTFGSCNKAHFNFTSVKFLNTYKVKI